MQRTESHSVTHRKYRSRSPTFAFQKLFSPIRCFRVVINSNFVDWDRRRINPGVLECIGISQKALLCDGAAASLDSVTVYEPGESVGQDLQRQDGYLAMTELKTWLAIFLAAPQSSMPTAAISGSLPMSTVTVSNCRPRTRLMIELWSESHRE